MQKIFTLFLQKYKKKFGIYFFFITFVLSIGKTSVKAFCINGEVPEWPKGHVC